LFVASKSSENFALIAQETLPFFFFLWENYFFYWFCLEAIFFFRFTGNFL
jgi:hypothetical protein